MLKKTHHQDALVARHDVLGAVAVVHVKVHNRHPFEAMALQSIFGGDGHVVKKAKSHGLVSASVVTRWAHGTKGVLKLSGQHGVCSIQGGTRRGQSRIPGVDIDHRVGVQAGVRGAACGDVFAQGIAQTTQSRHMHAAVGQLDVGQSGRCRLAPLQRHVHATDQQAVFDGPQALRALRVTRTHFMMPTSWVGEITCRAHECVFPMHHSQQGCCF